MDTINHELDCPIDERLFELEAADNDLHSHPAGGRQRMARDRRRAGRMNLHELAAAGLNEHRLFTFLDLAGTFAFAISGAVAARDRRLDWFTRSRRRKGFESRQGNCVPRRPMRLSHGRTATEPVPG
jgi:hypothetical protein